MEVELMAGSVARWRDLVPVSERDPGVRSRFQRAGRSTEALLVAAGQVSVRRLYRSDRNGHAEEQLLRSEGWRLLVDQLLRTEGTWTPQVTILVNRTPCHLGCSLRLSEALERILATPQGPRIRERTRFVLACTGIYETHGPLGSTDDQGPTKNTDLRRLVAAGWTLRALDAGKGLTSRGKILAEYIPRVEAYVASAPHGSR